MKLLLSPFQMASVSSVGLNIPTTLTPMWTILSIEGVATITSPTSIEK